MSIRTTQQLYQGLPDVLQSVVDGYGGYTGHLGASLSAYPELTEDDRDTLRGVCVQPEIDREIALDGLIVCNRRGVPLKRCNLSKLAKLERLYRLIEGCQPSTILGLKDIHMVRWQLVAHIEAYKAAYTKLGGAPIEPSGSVADRIDWTNFCDQSSRLYATIGGFAVERTSYSVTARCAMPLLSTSYTDVERTQLGRTFNHGGNILISIHNTNQGVKTIIPGSTMTPHVAACMERYLTTPLAGQSSVASEFGGDYDKPVVQDRTALRLAPDCGREGFGIRSRILDEQLTQVMVELMLQNKTTDSLKAIIEGADGQVLVAGGFKDFNRVLPRDGEILDAILKLRTAREDQTLYPARTASFQAYLKREDLAEERVYFRGALPTRWSLLTTEQPILQQGAGVFPEFWRDPPTFGSLSAPSVDVEDSSEESPTSQTSLKRFPFAVRGSTTDMSSLGSSDLDEDAPSEDGRFEDGVAPAAWGSIPDGDVLRVEGLDDEEEIAEEAPDAGEASTHLARIPDPRSLDDEEEAMVE